MIFTKIGMGVNLVCGWSKKTYNIFNFSKYEKLLKERYSYARSGQKYIKKFVWK